MSKHRGEEMSSRLMPANTGEMFSTTSTIRSGSWVLMQMGKASTPPKVLNKMALPSITGSAARGPIFPRPRTALPSVTMATRLFLQV